MAAAPSPSVALLCCAWRDGGLAALLPAQGGRDALLQAPLPSTQTPDAAVEILARRSIGRLPTWRSQVAALREGSALTVLYVAVLPPETDAPDGMRWQPLGRGTSSAAMRAALAHLRDRLDREPLAFRLLGSSFTLSDLQQVYELLLERRVHKASFRRALMAAHLVEPTDQWRSEGRGRPAQLFRYAPRRRRGAPRAVRFDLLG